MLGMVRIVVSAERRIMERVVGMRRRFAYLRMTTAIHAARRAQHCSQA